MVTDSMTNASIPMAAKDFAKKKRANRSAKLKQCKLDARREQWLSQVKNKGCKEETVHERDGSDRSMENLEIKPRGKMNESSIHHHFSDLDSPSNSPSSVSGSNLSGTNFTGSSRSSSSSSSSSGGSCSGSITGEDEEGGLDDWEAVADALAADDDKQEQEQPNPSLEPLVENESIGPLDSPNLAPGIEEVSEAKPESVEKAKRVPPNCRAWKPDDVFRPQSLPNLSKQLSFPMNSGRRYGCGGGAWGCKSVISAPSSCPICCEDLDITDSSFQPCSCGFRLCLFCHKRILEDDGRCPGCRKQYDYEPIKGEATLDGGSVKFRLARSCSMITRS